LPTISRSALLPYPRESVYEIVSDVGRYPEFVPWCSSSEILAQDELTVTATLQFGAKGLRETVTTRNTLVPVERIELNLVSGPFAEFLGIWHFAALGDGAGCKVQFDLDYRLAGRHLVLRPAFVGQAADKLVDAFAARCAALLD